MRILITSIFLFLFVPSWSVDYHVGPGQTYLNINDVPWELMNAGDNVFIHYRPSPYLEKWVINVPGTSIDMTPPPGFIQKKNFPGFVHHPTKSSISVAEIPVPMQIYAKKFSSKATLKKQRIQ